MIEMTDDRFNERQKEVAFLAEAQKTHPELFPIETWVDDDTFLHQFGIHIPGKALLPNGYLKYRPEDFIVEEIDFQGTAHDVSIKQVAPAGEQGQTTFATLVKCGISTIEAQADMAKALGIEKERIQYSGIKDKDALTSQKISFRNVPKSEVEKLSSPYFFLKGIYEGKGVAEKGRLQGNRFTILLRSADLGDSEKMQACLEALERVTKEGFYNFFYVQRFGAPRYNNFQWAAHILRGDYKAAVKGYLTDAGVRETPFFRGIRESLIPLIPDWSAVEAVLAQLPMIFANELKVVRYLKANPTDALGALQTIPEQVNLWVYALGSLLYNRQLSSYIEAGMNPPAELSLFLSKDKNDWLPYADDLEAFGIFPPNLDFLRPFPAIQTRGAKVKTKDHVEIHGSTATSEGIIVEFSLGKGEYATTFLSHIMNLITGEPGNGISDEKIDTRKALGGESLEDTFKYFESVSHSKRERK